MIVLLIFVGKKNGWGYFIGVMFYCHISCIHFCCLLKILFMSIMASHDPSSLLPWCDKALLLLKSLFIVLKLNLLQVMALTQRQLDEAMKPQQFDSQPSVDLTVNFSKPSLPTSSILTREKPFSSVVSPINSLLAGEKIQFGKQ